MRFSSVFTLCFIVLGCPLRLHAGVKEYLPPKMSINGANFEDAEEIERIIGEELNRSPSPSTRAMRVAQRRVDSLWNDQMLKAYLALEVYLDEKEIADLRKEQEAWDAKVEKAIVGELGDRKEWGRETPIDAGGMWVEAAKIRIKEVMGRIEKLRPKPEETGKIGK